MSEHNRRAAVARAVEIFGGCGGEVARVSPLRFPSKSRRLARAKNCRGGEVTEWVSLRKDSRNDEFRCLKIKLDFASETLPIEGSEKM
ncbi:MAG: hypothetical protein VCB43_07480 [Myxococcota bacterium]